MFRRAETDGAMSTLSSIHKSHNPFTAAGALVLVSLVGATTGSWLWWALVPAVGLMALGLAIRPRFASEGVARAVALVAAAVLAFTFIMSLVGLVVTQRIGMEPSWLDRGIDVIGTSVVAAFVAVGVLVSRGGRPGSGVVLAASLPAGITIDYAIAELLPPGFFLEGAGYYVGMLLVAFALIRIGRPISSVSDGTRRRRRDARVPVGSQV